MKINLVIADDHPVIREGFKSLLIGESEIGEIFLAANGRSVIELVTNHDIDIVLLDLRMPVLNGRKTLKILSDQFPSIKVIVLTMEYSPTTEMEMISLGACAFKSKSITIAELIKTVVDVFNNPKPIVQESLEPYSLSAREEEIVQLLADGLTTQQISDQLCISRKTIENHKTNIFKKLNVTNTALLIKKASELLIIN